jgi:hypothetical protein
MKKRTENAMAKTKRKEQTILHKTLLRSLRN